MAAYFWVVGGLFAWVVCCQAQSSINATIACSSCTSYIVTFGTYKTPVNCPVGTVCSISSSNSSAPICAATHLCDGVMCNRYAVFPSSSSCQQFHVCRYLSAYKTYAVTMSTCPGASVFDSSTNKCTLSETALCYNATAAAG